MSMVQHEKKIIAERFNTEDEVRGTEYKPTADQQAIIDMMIKEKQRNPIEEIKHGALEDALRKSLYQKTGQREAIRGVGFFSIEKNQQKRNIELNEAKMEVHKLKGVP